MCRLQGCSMMYFQENWSCAATLTSVCDAVAVFTRRLRGKRRLLECGLKVKLGLQHWTAVFEDARVSYVVNRGRQRKQLCYGSFDCGKSVYLEKFTTSDPDLPHQFLWRGNSFLDFYSQNRVCVQKYGHCIWQPRSTVTCCLFFFFLNLMQ